MRWADRGPTPGRHRKAFIRSSRPRGVFIWWDRYPKRISPGLRTHPLQGLSEVCGFLRMPERHWENRKLERQLHSRWEIQARGKTGHSFLRRGFHPADGVVHRCGDEVFQHFLVISHERTIDADT